MKKEHNIDFMYSVCIHKLLPLLISQNRKSMLTVHLRHLVLVTFLQIIICGNK